MVYTEPFVLTGGGAGERDKLENEKDPGETVAYETLLQAWQEGRVR